MIGCGKVIKGDIPGICGWEIEGTKDILFCSSCQATKETSSLDAIGAKLRGKQKECELMYPELCRQLNCIDCKHHLMKERRLEIQYNLGYNQGKFDEDVEWRVRIQKALEKIRKQLIMPTSDAINFIEYELLGQETKQ